MREQIFHGYLLVTPSLFAVNRLLGKPGDPRGASLDHHKHKNTIHAGDHIRLSRLASPVALNDLNTRALKKRASNILSPTAKLFALLFVLLFVLLRHARSLPSISDIE
jgi:hypothetical protein